MSKTRVTHPLYEPYEAPDCPHPPSCFTAEENGDVMVDRWYPRQIISPEVLGYGVSELIQTRITVTCANGRAVYRVIGMASDGRNLVCEQEEAMIAAKRFDDPPIEHRARP